MLNLMTPFSFIVRNQTWVVRRILTMFRIDTLFSLRTRTPG